MNFETLKKYHLWPIEVTLKSGEVYKGIITSHFFKENSVDEIERISLMGYWSIVRINCRDIKEIKKIQ